MDFSNNDLLQIFNALNGGNEKVKGSDFANYEENINTTTPVQLLPPPGAGYAWAVTNVLITNSSETVATKVRLLEGGTAIYGGEAGIKGGGYVLIFGGDSPLIITPTLDVNFECVTTGSSINISIKAFKIAV